MESTVNKIDRNYKPKRDHEVVFGIDREVGQNFAIGAAYTWRKADNWSYRPRLAGTCSGDPTFDSCPLITPEDYTANAPTSANGYTGSPTRPTRPSWPRAAAAG